MIRRTKSWPIVSRGMIALLVAGGLSGCMSSGFGLFGGPDKSISTNAVSSKASGEAVSDAATVRNAVSSADVSRTGSPIPWANASTGSAGVITSLSEDKDLGTVCRQFRTTRHSYEGIANFEGKACMEGDGRWQLLSFQEAG